MHDLDTSISKAQPMRKEHMAEADSEQDEGDASGTEKQHEDFRAMVKTPLKIHTNS